MKMKASPIKPGVKRVVKKPTFSQKVAKLAKVIAETDLSCHSSRDDGCHSSSRSVDTGCHSSSIGGGCH